MRRTSRCPLCANSGHSLSITRSLVGPEENRLRDGNIERVCRFRVYDQLKLRRPLNRQRGRFGTLENAVNVVSEPMVGSARRGP